jgi:hypothetical protein
VSEFTDKHKFMTVNANTLDTDINALLRQIAVTYPTVIGWRNERSYMVTQTAKIDRNRKELVVSGYIRNNFLNIKRLVHITGLASQQGFKVKQIELNQDPCPQKLTKKEVDRVMSTSRAQSIVSSRMSSRMTSRRDSRRGSFDMEEDDGQVTLANKKDAPRTKDGKIINKLQDGESRDSEQAEQIPDPFGAEQTYLTEEDIKNA